MTSDLDPRFGPYAEWILEVAARYTGGAAVTSTRRSSEHQAQLYAYNPSGLPVCKPGTSTHELGLAVDLVVPAGKHSDAQAWLGAVWNYYLFPGTWHASDPVHFSPFSGCL